MIIFPPPHLRTYARKPSWLNRAGRVDRSACVELRASELRALANESAWRATRVPSCPRSSTSRQRTTLEAFALVAIDAAAISRLHESRRPLQLVGDFRSVKSNAMKTHIRDRRTSIARNPNRGGMRIKKLGVWSGPNAGERDHPRLAQGWTQVIRLERWRLHARLAQHFLICPRCPPARPQRKHLKLFMPVAMEQELHDARLAEGWVRMLDERRIASRMPLDRDMAALRAKVIDRYAPLFHIGGRELICRQCLGVRYGEVKWPRLKAKEARLRSRAAVLRAREEAQAQAERDAERQHLMQQVAEAIGPAALEREAHELALMLRQRERRMLTNLRRREQRRRERAWGAGGR